MPHDLLNPLKGWEEIRQALLFVESLSAFSRHTLAGVEIHQQPEVSSTRVFIRTLEELDNYLEATFKRMQLVFALDTALGFTTHSEELDVLSEVYGQIVLDYPYDVNKSHEMKL